MWPERHIPVVFIAVGQNSASLSILLNHLLTAERPARRVADCASFLMLRFSAALGGSIHGGLLTGDLPGKCHLCKPDLEKHEIAIALGVYFV